MKSCFGILRLLHPQEQRRLFSLPELRRCFKFIMNALKSSQAVTERDCTVSHFSRCTGSLLLVGPYVWVSHKKNSISFSLRKWGGCSESDTDYELSHEMRNYPSYSCCHLLFLLTLLMTEIEARSEFCFSVKSRVRPPESEDEEASSLERLSVPLSYLLQLAFRISSSMLKHTVSKQYLTKQPRWSSDVIKAGRQEVLLLCAVNALVLLFFIRFSP